MLQLVKNCLHGRRIRTQAPKQLLQSIQYNINTSQKKTCYYKILNVSTEATIDEIKHSYRELAKIYHPDTGNPLSRQADKFREINEAFEVLCDANLRSKYDLDNGIISQKKWSKRANFGQREPYQKSDTENPELQQEMENYFNKKYFLNKDYFKVKNEDEDNPYNMSRKLYNKHKDFIEKQNEEYEMINKFTSYAYYKKKEAPKKETEEREEK